MKGIILAGGSGTRLSPITRVACKQLLHVYDKPMVYYPLSTLMLAGIREILVISTPKDLPRFKDLLQSGEQFGCHFSYKEQLEPKGIAQAFLIGEEFIGKDKVALILGDNLFHGSGLGRQLSQLTGPKGATIFGIKVNNPEVYGVVEFDQDEKVISIEEKPKAPKSNFAVPGLYFYDNSVIGIAKGLNPSARGELEITGINQTYLQIGQLNVQKLGRGTVWLDTGTFESLHDASSYVKIVQEREGNNIGCPEEVAWRMGYINDAQLRRLAADYKNSDYGDYLERMLNEAD